MPMYLFANGATGEFEKDIFEIGEDGAEVGDADVVLGQAVNDGGDEVVAAAADGDCMARGFDGFDIGEVAERCEVDGAGGGENDCTFGAVAGDEGGGGVDVDDAAVLHDGYAIAEALGFFHEVGGEEYGFAAVADAADEAPDGVAGLGIEAGGELVEEDDFGVVDEGESDEEALLLAAGEIHEPGVALVGEAELVE